MHPDIVIILLQANVVAFVAVTVHKSDIAYFNVGCIFNAQSPAIGYSIISYSFKSDVTGSIVLVFDHYIAIQHIVRIGDLPYKSDNERTGIVSFFETIQDSL